MAERKVLRFGVSQALVIGALCVAPACSGEKKAEPAVQVNPGPCLPGQDPVRDGCEAQAVEPLMEADAAADMVGAARPVVAAPDMAPDLEEAPQIPPEPINVNPGPYRPPKTPKPELKPQPIRVNPGPRTLIDEE